MYIVNVQVYRIHVCFRMILIFFQLGKLLTPTLRNIQNPESCKTLVTRSWAGAAPGALEAVGRSPSVQRESALAAPRSRESERTFWEWLDDLRIGVDYPGGDHLGRVSGAVLSVRDVSRSRLSLVLRSLVRKSTTTSYFVQKKGQKTTQFLTGWTKSHVEVLCTLLSSGLAILLPACGNNDAGEGQNCEMIINDHIIF